jgi:hypothetical protein
MESSQEVVARLEAEAETMEGNLLVSQEYWEADLAKILRDPMEKQAGMGLGCLT